MVTSCCLFRQGSNETRIKLIIVNQKDMGYNGNVFLKKEEWSTERVNEMNLNEFFEYLEKQKKMSANTIEAYRRDVLEFQRFKETKGNGDLRDTVNTEIVSYLLKLKTDGKSAATVNRKLASIRALFNYLVMTKQVAENPTLNIKSPKIERKEIQYLEVEEIERILALPDDSDKGIRDKAILELLYATGIRVSELIEANTEDMNMKMGFITCAGEQSKARIIPLGRPARTAMENYIFDVRDKMIKDNKSEKALFVNYYGKRITRQGLWKILREYGKRAGLEHKLSPNVIRNSFAVHMTQNGADLKSLQELLGHEDISATQAYLAVTKHRIKDVYDKTHPRA